jgi:predicted lipase
MAHLKKIILSLCLLANCLCTQGQIILKPGFDPGQYIRLLEITHKQTAGLYPTPEKPTHDSTASRSANDTIHLPAIPPPAGFRLVYRSPETGLYNRWALWLRDDSAVAVISIRGTIMNTASWMENFYAAMVPATGEIQWNDSVTFHYKLAEDPRATVHAGWLLGLASLAPTILQEIRRYEKLGVKQFIIFGHSQGGALAFLVRSYLHYLPEGALPKDIVYKTYCSAAPKPGNLYYAYDFDYITRGGWAFRVVNARDWVPETPFSIQTLEDFNTVNPFQNIKPALKHRSLLVKLYAGHVFNKLDRSSKKANKKFRRVLGHTVYKQIHQTLPEFREPVYAKSMNYMTAGTPVILMSYADYDHDFPFDGKNVFIHHGLKAYYLLTMHQYASSGLNR